MENVVTAYRRALHSLSQPAILWHLIWPTLAALVIWGWIAWLFWDRLAAATMQTFNELPWLQWFISRWDAMAVMTEAVVTIFLWLLLVPLVYITALLIVAIVALPMMLERVAQRDYRDLERRNGGTLAGSVVNALLASLLFALGWFVTLPLWLIPGMALVLPVLLSAYLSQHAYRYDALMEHADAGEMRIVVARERGALYLVGIGAGLLSYVPVANLLAPAFAGLAFVHYCLEALRRHRAGGPRKT
jgi:hypothetical protein